MTGGTLSPRGQQGDHGGTKGQTSRSAPSSTVTSYDAFVGTRSPSILNWTCTVYVPGERSLQMAGAPGRVSRQVQPGSMQAFAGYCTFGTTPSPHTLSTARSCTVTSTR